MAKFSQQKSKLKGEIGKEGDDVETSKIHDFLLYSDQETILAYVSIFSIYLLIFAIIADYRINYWYFLLYIPLFYMLSLWRRTEREKERLRTAHRIPFFAESLANALSVGATIEQALMQASFYLRGKIRREFNKLMLQSALGKDLGTLMRDLDATFPNTGLRYLISLLEEYQDLGVGISPMLKKISVALAVKEDAEEKIRTILSAGSSYAQLTIFVFVAIFISMSYLLREQAKLLFSPQLKPAFYFLVVWACAGVFLVTRITSIEFSKVFSLRPYMEKFMKVKSMKLDDMIGYAGLEWSPNKKRFVLCSPLLTGFFIAYLTSWYDGNSIVIGIGFLFGAMGGWFVINFILKGIISDEMIKTIEIFPELLQVFVIGLNSGLNTYLAFQFAENAIRGGAPSMLLKELRRIKLAMECGEDYSASWQKLAEALPFEIIVDFCELMVVAPMHGESIVNSITQMTNSYQTKKLALVEKKATTLGQVVIPIIVIAFFPLFLFAVFAPLVMKIILFVR